MPVIQFPIALGRYRAAAAFEAHEEAAGILEALAPLMGGEVDDWAADISDRHAGEVLARLSRLSRQENADQSSAVVWVGHGESNDVDAVLIVPGVASGDSDSALLPAELAKSLADQSRRRLHLDPRPWTIVVVEACGAGRFVELVNAHLHTLGGVRGVGLIGVGDSLGFGHAGTARDLLTKAIAALDPNTTLVRLNDFMTEVSERLGEGRIGSVGSCHLDGYTINRPQLVLSANLDTYAELREAFQGMSEDMQAHFARKGLASDFGELDWLFVGRHEERVAIVNHLLRGAGLLAFTGPAGSGKSAILGNVFLRSHPGIRSILLAANLLHDDPPIEGEDRIEVDEWLLLSGLTFREALERIAAAAGIKSGIEIPEHAILHSLLESQSSHPLTLVVDALDEARDPGAIAFTLRKLAAAGACVVIGTRASVDEGPDHSARGARDLLDQLGADDDHTLRVSRDPELLRRYLERVLSPRDSASSPANEFTVTHSQRKQVIDAICYPDSVPGADPASGREFLFARLIVSELAALPEMSNEVLADLLMGNHRTLFAHAVERLGTLNSAIPLLLEALSHAQGNGIPRMGTVWATVASAISGDRIGPDDIDLAVLRAAPYISIAAEGGQAVYKLAHNTFIEHFRQSDDGRDKKKSIMWNLIALAERTAADLNPYLYTYLAAHVGAASPDGWAHLAQHEWILDFIDPSSTAAELMRTGLGRATLPAVLCGYLAQASVLRESDSVDRQGLRQLGTAWFGTVEGARSRPGMWAVLSGARTRRTPHLAIQTQTGGVSAVTRLSTIGTAVRLASGGVDGTVQVWDPGTGQPVSGVLKGSAGWVRGVAGFATRSGRVLLALCHDNGTVQVWDPSTSRVVGPVLRDHRGPVRAITAFTSNEGRVLLASAGDDRTVRVWDRATDHAQALTGHTDRVRTVTAFTDSRGQILLASGGDDRTIRIWDPAIGRQIGEPFLGHTDWVRTLTAFTDSRGQILLASGSNDRTIRIWDPETGQQRGSALEGHAGPLTSVTALPSAHGRAWLVTAGEDGSVRVWDTSAVDQIGDPLTAHVGSVVCVTALEDDRGEAWLVTAGEDGTARIWDPLTGDQIGDPLEAHSVSSLTAFSPQGQGSWLVTGQKMGPCGSGTPSRATE